jgi:muramoyltetrapeptide carboxypeptidase LdcA involved in peptidoglycan recycling
MIPNVKVGISVYIDMAGNIAFTSTSKNQVTNLGLLECAKAIVLGTFKAAENGEDKRVIVPEVM